ncbi:hypothetical protein FJTKL_13930 [Diaporthe vaccinii]|uniref:Uncharacterized protein n=1 Tax=Diaporthe vaccinii TaxID=105482 RepID=A0ABR4F9G7_9PEZI
MALDTLVTIMDLTRARPPLATNGHQHHMINHTDLSTDVPSARFVPLSVTIEARIPPSQLSGSRMLSEEILIGGMGMVRMYAAGG